MNTIPRGLPLSGPDYRIDIHSTAYGGRDSVIEKKGDILTIDHPGVSDDLKVTLGQDALVVEKPFNGARLEITRQGEQLKLHRPTVPYGDLTITREGEKITVDRQAAFRDVTYERTPDAFRIDREAAGKDVELRRTPEGYSIEREGNFRDVSIKLTGPAAEQGLDMATWAPRLGLEPEGYQLVDKWMREGLAPADLITVTERGELLVGDKLLT